MARPNLHPFIPGESDIDIERSMATVSLQAASGSSGDLSCSVSGTSPGTVVESGAPSSRSQQCAEGAEITYTESADASSVEISGPWVPLKDFHIFPGLPPEIRIEIWKCAAHLGRIIEIQAHRESDYSGVLAWFGPDYAVTPVSYKAPAVLHTSREARSAALPFYPQRDLGAATLSTTPKLRLLYFNNTTDILLFGKGCGANGVINKVLADDVTAQFPVARVAIRMEELSGPTALLDFLKKMHGFLGRQAGCIGLGKISFIIPTKGWGCDTAVIDEKWALLPTVNNGLTSTQITDTIHARDMAGRTGLGGGNLIINNWLRKWVTSGENAPTFKFSSLRPIGREDNKVRDGVNVSPANILDLTEHNGYILKQFEKMLDIEIDLPSPGMNPRLPASTSTPLFGRTPVYGHDDKCMEIGVTGINKWQVEKGIKAIKDFLVHVSNLSGAGLELCTRGLE